MRIAAIVLGVDMNEDAASGLLKRLELGIPVEAIPLTQFRVGLTREELLGIWRAGVESSKDLAAMSGERHKAIVGGRAGRLLEEARALIVNAP